ncbi:MAG: hypothetical protein FWG68_04865 [Defluviitaleaceae bacterium]|nr:hypothetical protein [Defluviitaleaceae bacterium]
MKKIPQKGKIIAILFSFAILSSLTMMSAAFLGYSEQEEVEEYSQNSISNRAIGIPPELFGGRYFNEAGILVTLLVDSAATAELFDLPTLLAMGPLFRLVEFSYSELSATMAYLQRVARRDINIIFGVADRFSLDVVRNRVTIHLIDFTPEQEELFRANVLDSPMLYFVQSDGAVEPIPDLLVGVD